MGAPGLRRRLASDNGCTTCFFKIIGNSGAFAAILDDGTVRAWGHPDYGGDCTAVADYLHNVVELQATSMAFAAILGNRTVVTWGAQDYGGNSDLVRGSLYDARCIAASLCGFAALRAGDNEVVVWGDHHQVVDDAAAIKGGQRRFVVVHSDGATSQVPDPERRRR